MQAIMGMMAGSTRILVTHQLQFLPQVMDPATVLLS